MRYTDRIKLNGYLQAKADEVQDQLAAKREPLAIAKNGEVKEVMLDVAFYDDTQQTLTLLKILTLGNWEIEEGKVKPIADVVNRLRAKKMHT